MTIETNPGETVRNSPEGIREHVGSARRAVRRRVPEPILRFGGWLRGDEFVTTSASLAFYAMVSLPPMALVALWAAGGVISESALQNLGSEVRGQAPDALPVGNAIRGLIDVAGRIGPMSALTAIWPATAYGAALARAFTRVTPDQQRQFGGWKGRLFALAIIAILPVVVFAALAVLYLGPRLLNSSGRPLTLAFAVASFVVLALIVALIFFLFRLRDTAPADIALCALITTGLEAAVTAGYIVYLEVFANFTERYGASFLATAVLLGLWLLLSNAVLLVGYRILLRRAVDRGES